MSLELSGGAKVAERTLAARLERQTVDEDTQHDINLPNIGLKPKKAKLPAQDAWIQGNLQEMASETERKLADLWIELYCSPSDEAGGIEVQGEQALRCVRQSQAKLPGFIEEWYRANFGMGASEVTARLASARP